MPVPRRLQRLARLAAWTARARARRVVEAHRALWLGLLFAVAQLWTMVDWTALARSIAALGPARGLLGGALVLAVARRAGPLRVDPAFARLLRPGETGPVLLPAALLVAAPALVVSVLFPGGPALRAIGWGGLVLWAGRAGGWAAVLGLAVAGEALGDRFGGPPAAGVTLGAFARVGLDLVVLATVGLPVPRLGLPRALGSWPGAAPGGGWRGAWRPRTPLGALVGRDLLCLWRTDRGVVLGACAAAPLPAALVWGLRVNGELRGPDLARAVAVLLCFVAVGPAAGLGRLRARLGRAFFPRAWPVSARLRLGSLVVVFLALLAPTHVAMAATGGLDATAPPLGVALLLAAGAVWLASRDGAPRSHWFLGWALVALPFALGGWFLPAAVCAALPLAHAARRWTWR